MLRVHLVESVKSVEGIQGRIYTRRCGDVVHCFVFWITGEYMHFVGPASILFRLSRGRQIVVEFDGKELSSGPCVKASLLNYMPSNVQSHWNYYTSVVTPFKAGETLKCGRKCLIAKEDLRTSGYILCTDSTDNNPKMYHVKHDHLTRYFSGSDL